MQSNFTSFDEKELLDSLTVGSVVVLGTVVMSTFPALLSIEDLFKIFGARDVTVGRFGLTIWFALIAMTFLAVPFRGET